MSDRKLKIPATLFRSGELRAEGDGEKKAMRVTISSDTPYLREGWDPEDDYYEVLSHDPKDISSDRLKLGLPMLFNHKRDAHLGRAKGFSNDGHKLDVGTTDDLIWSESADAQSKKKDVENGALVGTSVGYSIKGDGECIGAKDGKPVIRFAWEPHEFSFCTIEADTTVGAGRARSENDETKEILIRDEKNLANEKGKSQKREHMETEIEKPSPAEPVKVDLVKERKDAIARERERVKGIEETAEAFGDRAKDVENFDGIKKAAIEGEMSKEDFLKECYAKWKKAKPINEMPDQKIGMEKKDLRAFSIRKLILESYLEGRGKGEITGVEKEASAAAFKKYAGKDDRGFSGGPVIPHDVRVARTDETYDLDSTGMRNLAEKMDRLSERLGRRDLSASSFASGGFLVQTDILGGSFIDILRNAALIGQGPFEVIELGGLVGNIAIPKQLTTLTIYWLSEGAQVTAGNFTGAQLLLTPHRMSCQSNWTKQLLEQADISVEMLVRNDQARAMAVEEDKQFIQGSGVNGQPLGIVNTTGTGADVTFASGAATWANIVTFEYGIENANVIGEIAFLTTPLAKSYLKQTLVVSGSTFPIFLWMDANGEFPVIRGINPGKMNGYPAYATKNMPADFVIGGVWRDNAIRARWGGMDLLTEPYTGAATETIKTYLNQWVDFGFRYPQGFEISTNSVTQN